MISMLFLSSESWPDLKIVDLYTYFVFIFGKTAGVAYIETLLLTDQNCSIINTNVQFFKLTNFTCTEQEKKTFATGPDLRTANQEALLTGWLARLMLVQVDTCPHRAKPTLIVNTTHYCTATILEDVTYQAAALMLLKLLSIVNLLPGFGFVAD